MSGHPHFNCVAQLFIPYIGTRLKQLNSFCKYSFYNLTLIKKCSWLQIFTVIAENQLCAHGINTYIGLYIFSNNAFKVFKTKLLNLIISHSLNFFVFWRFSRLTNINTAYNDELQHRAFIRSTSSPTTALPL